MDYGTHCNYCGRLDFLPFDCRKCGKVVCGEHRINHDCVREKVLPVPASPPRSKDAQENVQQRKAEPKPQPQAPEPRRERDGGRLGTQKGAVKTDRAAAAFERLKMLVAGSGRSNAAPKQAAKAPASPAAPAELKKTATGNPHLKFADRFYYRVQRPEQPYKDVLTGTTSMRPGKIMPLYFDRALTVGQVLDEASKHLGVNSHGAGMRRLNGSQLDLSAPISGVPQGATLVITL